MTMMMVNSGPHKGKLVEIKMRKYGYIVFVTNQNELDMLPEHCLERCK